MLLFHFLSYIALDPWKENFSGLSLFPWFICWSHQSIKDTFWVLSTNYPSSYLLYTFSISSIYHPTIFLSFKSIIHFLLLETLEILFWCPSLLSISIPRLIYCPNLGWLCKFHHKVTLFRLCKFHHIYPRIGINNLVTLF